MATDPIFSQDLMIAAGGLSRVAISLKGVSNSFAKLPKKPDGSVVVSAARLSILTAVLDQAAEILDEMAIAIQQDAEGTEDPR